MVPAARVATVCVLAFAWLAASTVAAAGQSPASQNAILEGFVRDSVSGQPMQKTWVCGTFRTGPSSGTGRCRTVDSSGAYRIDSLPTTRILVTVQCEVVGGSHDKHLASDSVVLMVGVPVRRDWMTSPVGCDPRPTRRISGTFRGHYTSGFEASEFVPCAVDGWFIRGDSLGRRPYDERRAWAEWKPGLMRTLVWPRLKRDEYGASRYYVRWRGTVVGPGRYGHMGVSAFEIQVDSVLELRAPRPRDCR